MSIYFVDMDGTLIDTDYANFLAYQCAVREATDGRFDIHYASGRRFNRQALKESLPQLPLDCIVELKAECYAQFLPETKINTALLDRLRMLNATSITVLVTDCEEKRAIQTLRHHGLESLFNNLCCRTPGQSGNKYCRALAQLRVPSQSVVVFENEASGINQAVLAGIPRESVISITS